MKLIFTKILVILLIMVSMPGFALGQSDKGRGMTLEDDLGNQVVIKAKPRRIISGAQFIDELIFSIAEKRNILAITNFSADKGISNIAEEAANMEHQLGLNIEAYLDLEPDLIILADWADPSKVQQLRDIGIPLYQVTFPKTLEEVKTLILTRKVYLI